MRASLLVVAGVAVGSGCSSVCKGPGCADSYTASRVSILGFRADLPDPIDPDRDADTRFDGDVLDGADWSARAGPPGTVFLGMPEAGRVVRVLAADGVSGVDPVLEVTGPEGFGASLQLADLDGDGVRDLVVGAPGVAFSAGAVYVFYGGGVATGTLSTADADLVIHGTSPSDQLGADLALCADLTGDGLPELALPSPWLEVPRDRSEPIPPLGGAVFLVRSELLPEAQVDAEPWALGPVWWGDAVGDAAGTSVACQGDVTGDRRADVVIGAPFSGASGRVYLLFPTDPAAGEPLPEAGPLGDAADAFLVPGTLGAWFGHAVATGEFGGEPPLELVVGAPGAHEGAGRVEIFEGSDLLSGNGAAWEVLNTRDRGEPDHLGKRVMVGDFDGDDLDDLWVGAPDWYAGGNAYDAGALFGWSGVSVERITTFTVASAEWTVAGTTPFQRVGRAAELVPLLPDAPAALLVPTRTAP